MAVYYAKEIQAATAISQPSKETAQFAQSCQYCDIHSASEYIHRTFLQYDLSQIPYGSVITSAKLKAYCNLWNDDGGNARNNVARVTGAWDENTLNWNNAPAWEGTYLSEDTAPPAVGEWTDWDITALVQEWVGQVHPNYGLHIVNIDEGGYRVNWAVRNRFFNNGELATYIEIDCEPVAEYRISEVRMTEIADQVRRIAGTVDVLTPKGIVEALSGIAVEAAAEETT